MHRRNMLLIDDDDALVSMLPLCLAEQAWHTYVARNTEEVTRQLASRLYDLIVLDIAMTGKPLLHGIDLIGDVRSQQPRSKIVVLSAFGSIEMMAAATERGADGFLHKPAGPEEIRTEIRRLVNGNERVH